MKILLISTNYGGGAAIACRRQHQALLKNGVDSNLLVLDKVNSPEEKNVYSIQELISKKHGNWYFIFLKFCNRILNKFPVFFNKKVYINGPASLFRIDKLKIYQEADIIHLHWVPKIISYKHVFADKKKVFFWTLHDMNPFTGGNHYTMDFDYSPYEKLLRKNIEKKKQYLENVNITIIAPSLWLGKLVKASEVFKKSEIKIIPYCIDTTVFNPINKVQARENLKINTINKKIILFVAENTNDKRKGIHLLLSALNKIKSKSQICVLIIGKKIENIDFDFQVKQLGVIKKQADIVSCYNSADFFVIPSIEDNLPNTVLESLACGTPVLGFNIGGIPDMIVNNKTGFLSEIDKEEDFIKNIDLLVEMDDYSNLSTNCRNSIVEKFSEKVIVPQLITLYSDHMNTK